MIQIPNPYCCRGQKWCQVLGQKRKAMLELLAAQRVIEEVEAEAKKHISTEMIAEIRSEFYCINNFPADEKHFITAIANIALAKPVCTSTRG